MVKIAVMIAQPRKNHATALLEAAAPSLWNQNQMASQNAPYEQNAVAPRVLPRLNSHRPASSCAPPP